MRLLDPAGKPLPPSDPVKMAERVAECVFGPRVVIVPRCYGMDLPPVRELSGLAAALGTPQAQGARETVD